MIGYAGKHWTCLMTYYFKVYGWTYYAAVVHYWVGASYLRSIDTNLKTDVVAQQFEDWDGMIRLQIKQWEIQQRFDQQGLYQANEQQELQILKKQMDDQKQTFLMKIWE